MKLYFLLILVLLCPSINLFAADNNDCLMCHGEQDMGMGAPRIKTAALKNSVHGGRLCISCHADAASFPHEGKVKAVNCGKCHQAEVTAYNESDHRLAGIKLGGKLSACSDCHEDGHEIIASKNTNSRVHKFNQPKTCGKCHENEEFIKSAVLSQRHPVTSFSNTVHGKSLAMGGLAAASCSDCHGAHDINSGSTARSHTVRVNIPDTCGRCHPSALNEYSSSIHGQAAMRGVKEAPVCTDCHGEHSIQGKSNGTSSVNIQNVTKTCGDCHEDAKMMNKFNLMADREETWKNSYHGLASKAGENSVANCTSCHGSHSVFRQSDERSQIHPSNLGKTCGSCHNGAAVKFVNSKIHVAGSSYAVAGGGKLALLIKTFYIFVIILTVGGILFHNGIDIMRKMLSRSELAPLKDEKEDDVLLNKSERIQHAVLLGSFVLLAYTGFALKYSDAWWAWPMEVLGGEPVRRLLHRMSAIVMAGLSLWHLWYMLRDKNGRRVLKNIMPVRRDFIDPVRLIMFNLGLQKERPVFARFSYIEKFEYWALIWGTVIMLISGVILTFHNFAMANFPLWVIDIARLIHILEAVLACAAIILWHFYWVILDPETYPMNWAWLRGVKHLYPTRKEEKEKKKLEKEKH